MPRPGVEPARTSYSNADDLPLRQESEKALPRVTAAVVEPFPVDPRDVHDVQTVDWQ